ncbi:hypothetical protein UMZ34_19975 [Halopseudomonas pachastrellae]|nr:hypothetical protein UMZ34_19975 [Halopseudomonas pachastrellae]
MANLQRLLGRFQIPVQLSDTDVESVIRKVILRKKASARPQLEQVMQSHLGEISRQLRGTKIEHHRDDERVMLADYPLLPVRRRFWEKVLRIVDTTGTASQLRNQLKVIHEAAQATADQPLGTSSLRTLSTIKSRSTCCKPVSSQKKSPKSLAACQPVMPTTQVPHPLFWYC